MEQLKNKSKKIDVRPIKNKLRLYHKNIRQNMNPQIKKTKEDMIFKRLISLPIFKKSKTILCFVSTDIEVDTKQFIEYALSLGKTIAVPKCIPKNSRMNFYTINSLKDLNPGTFSVLEPDADYNKLLLDFSDSFCIVPGLAFDMHGYRLGYGKGYYDRFLSKYPKNTLGICYSDCIEIKLPHNKYDQVVDMLITDKYTRKTHKN